MDTAGCRAYNRNYIVGGEHLGKVEIVMRYEKQGEISETVLASISDGDTLAMNPCEAVMLFPGLEIYLNEQAVYHCGNRLTLTRREYLTLVFLAKRPNWIFSARQIYEAVWQEDGSNCGTVVANIISQLRRKLAFKKSEKTYIHTVIGSGYKFEVPE